MEENRSTTITSVVAHIDHGKTSLIDSLVASQGRISKTLAGSLRFLDTREDEQVRGITLKLSAITLGYCGRKHIFIDTPGHVDFESLIQTSSILSDGFLILIDINEGITPRTYSLVNYTRGKSCVLAINKIDKILSEPELLQKTLSVVSSMNALMGEEMFGWESNNIILCCATLCYGINSKLFLKTVGRPGTLENAISFLSHLYKRIEKNEIEKICANFNIRVRNRKSILSTVLPLSECIFNSVNNRSTMSGMEDAAETSNGNYSDEVAEGKRSKIPGEEMSHSKGCGQKLQKHVEAFFRSDLINLRPMSPGRAPSLMGITVYGMLKAPGRYSRDSVLFVTRIFYGTIRTGDTVYSVDNKSIVECTINSIYVFGINELIEVGSSEGSNLVCLSGGFQKNSLITDIPTHWMEIESRITPFYKSKLVLDDLDQLDELKDVFRAMSCTEQFIKVKLNKYREMEVLCTGKVQFEKITADLTSLGFRYSIAGFEDQFCEYATEPFCGTFNLEDLILKLEICRVEDVLEGAECRSAPRNTSFKEWEDCNRNQFVLVSSLFSEIVESVLEIFVSSGPLIRGSIHETKFVLDVQGKEDPISSDALYSFFRNSLTSIYLSCYPSIAPLFYECSISVQEEFIGEIYKSLSKYSYVPKGEDYEENTGFYIIFVLIPQFMYAEFLEDVRIRTKGTAYLLLKEAGYVCVLDFGRYINDIRKKKGLFIEEKIVEEPSKQRTYKK